MLQKTKVVVNKAAGLFDTRDVFLAVGLGLMSYGFSMVWTPGAFVMPGAVLTWLAINAGATYPGKE